MRKILIDDEAVNPRGISYGLPWRHDSICFNFRGTEELVFAQNIDKLKSKADIDTLVVGCRLDDYSFIADMINLRHLYIYYGASLEDTDFCEKLLALRQLYIADSHIASLDGLIKLLGEKKKIYDAEKNIGNRLFKTMEGICIESECSLNGKELLEPGLIISELIVNKKHLKG